MTRQKPPGDIGEKIGSDPATISRRGLLALTTSMIVLGLCDSAIIHAQSITVTGRRPKPQDEALRAPRITLVSAHSYPPQIDLELDETYSVGCSVQLQGAATSSFAEPSIDITIATDASMAKAGEAIVAALRTIAAPARTNFRARGICGAITSPWSTIVRHGDAVPPRILSSETASFAENIAVAHMLKADKEVRWTILPGVDASLVEIVDNGVIRLFDNALPDFEQKQSYAVSVKAVDLAGNSAVQSILLRITDAEESLPSTWGPNIKSAYVTLSNGNLTATGAQMNVGAGSRVRATNARKGKRYFEVHIDQLGHQKNFVGLCSSLVDLVGQYDGAGARPGDGASLMADGTIFHNGATDFGPDLAFAAGDTIMIAFDTAASLVWFGRNGKWFGQPAAGTGGLSLGAMEDCYAFAAVLATEGRPNSMTVNFGAKPFAHTAPQGFSRYI